MGHVLDEGRLDLAHDLDTVGVKVVEKAGELERRTADVGLGDLDVFKVFRAVDDLKIELLDQVAQAHTKFF